MADKVRITLVRSPIGRLPKHRRTVAALGLRKLNHSVEKVKDASTLGMINAVSYLLKVEDV